MTEQLQLFRPYYNKHMEALKMYIVKQKDGEILAQSEFLDEVVKEVTLNKIIEIERYFNSVAEKMEYDLYFYMAGLYKQYKQADLLNGRDYLMKVLPKVYNNNNHIDKTEFITIEKC
ncbi:hypothetical protein [Staphylococcus pseudintermedius]|nr:hypothetical protein [Staphylococcus pseudintermedius]MDE9950280.1 hypothetical protein [Staphylococcus pseudintermedius]MDF0092164.1 hypothetical protein [Staphylococcus pseudintermedius]MDF0234761.1 hypothetical protein [Staphylococcus pseudintermedius]MDU0374423.1 hypothetical protein [Staphylococcus pseudintermedius]